MTDESNTKTSKPYFLQYYGEGWGGWRDMPHDTMVSDPAEFDTVKEGRKLAQDVSTRTRYRTRVVRRSDRVVVAEYGRGGRKIK